MVQLDEHICISCIDKNQPCNPTNLWQGCQLISSAALTGTGVSSEIKSCPLLRQDRVQTRARGQHE